MELCLRSSVNRWECDENDHMNVRYFVKKHWEALSAYLWERSAANADRVLEDLRGQHLRFLKEARIATPLSGYAGNVVMPDGSSRYVTELRQSFTQEVMSTCLHDLGRADLGPRVALSEHAAPRGLPDEASRFVQTRLEEASAQGFAIIGKGLLADEECNAQGQVLPHGYMGRLSDAMPHLWGAVHEQGVLDENEGGAVLEYRFQYRAGLKAGDTYQIWSGLKAAGPKIQEFVHLLFNSRAEIALLAQAVGVRMDLTARKTKTLSKQTQNQLRKHLITSPGE